MNLPDGRPMTGEWPPSADLLPALCRVKLYRCCGEGPLTCEKERGHEGPHEDEGVLYG